MDKKVFGRIKLDTPAFNQELVRGLAVNHLKSSRPHIDRIIRCAEEQYPDGLTFVDSERCTPLEEYNIITNIRGSNERIFDLAESYVTLYRYLFTLNGEPMPCYLWLPYAKQGGLIVINGKVFSISPVLADPVFSVGEDDIFIPMPRGKVTFNQVKHTVKINGVNTEVRIPWSPLHNRGARKGRVTEDMRSNIIRLGSVHTTLTHYLLARFGFEGAFKRFAHCDVHVMDGEFFNEEEYPKDKYVVCRSTKQRPTSSKLRPEAYSRIASDLVLIIRKEDFTPVAESMVTGVFYVVDHFPDEMTIQDIDAEWQWRVLMGYILWGDEHSKGKLVEQVEAHLKSLDGYVDLVVKRTLATEGVDVNDIYDLFLYIIQNMRKILNLRSGKVSSMYDKELMVLRYVLSDINNSIFDLLFKITSNNKKPVTKENLSKILADHFKPKTILKITSGKSHSEVSSVSSPSDNMFFKITSVLLQQSDTASKGRNKESRPVDATMFLDASFAEVGSMCVLPKTAPIGNNRANPTMEIDENNRVVRKEKFRTLIDRAQEKIKR